MLQKSTFAFLALLMGGCAMVSGYPESPMDETQQLQTLAPYFSPATYAKYDALTDANARKVLRNQILFGQVVAYDIKFTKFRSELSGQRNVTNAAADTAVAAMGAIGAAVGSEATKTALLAASATVTGAKGAIDKDIFYSQALSSLFTQMSGNRALALLQIENGTKLADADYPLTRGLVDVAAYRDAGSIPGAFTGIAVNAGNQKKESVLAIMANQQIKFNQPTVVDPSQRKLMNINPLSP